MSSSSFPTRFLPGQRGLATHQQPFHEKSHKYSPTEISGMRERKLLLSEQNVLICFLYIAQCFTHKNINDKTICHIAESFFFPIVFGPWEALIESFLSSSSPNLPGNFTTEILRTKSTDSGLPVLHVGNSVVVDYLPPRSHLLLLKRLHQCGLFGTLTWPVLDRPLVASACQSLFTPWNQIAELHDNCGYCFRNKGSQFYFWANWS